jgi:hypothetical protein
MSWREPLEFRVPEWPIARHPVLRNPATCHDNPEITGCPVTPCSEANP